MLIQGPASRRTLHTVTLHTDLTVVGGGLAGVCAAITAARAGLKVVLLQDRPVLGGNASSEVRLWVLGATAHMYSNNRWAREGGVIDELLVENLYRNPEGNPLIFDTVVLEWVTREPNITLLLNTAAFEAEKSDADTISKVRAFCSQNSTLYEISAPLFCDASGDGVLGFLAGAAFRMGAEASSEFNEKFAPSKEYGELLGHSMYFYSKDVGRPVKFVPPSFALKDITKVPRFRRFNAKEFGCRLWWIEYGGRLDTVHDTEAIKWELWKVVYGVWHHIKNSGQFPDAQNLTLEWVSTIPGKRESRRFEGDYMIHQRDLIEQTRFEDAVSFGGWSIDLHPADGVFSERPGCNQWLSKGVYQIPYRCLYSRNIRNLFLAGRIISASHVAFGSTRVIATCSESAQAVGLAAALCKQHQLQPRDLFTQGHVKTLQQQLLRTGQFIPHVPMTDAADLASKATITAGSHLQLRQLPACDDWHTLTDSVAMLLPMKQGLVPRVTLAMQADSATTVQWQLRKCSRPASFTPDVILCQREVTLVGGGKVEQVAVDFATTLEQAQYVFVCVMVNPAVKVALSDQQLTGVLSLFNHLDGIGRPHAQRPDGDIGVDEFELWFPKRRPEGRNLAMGFEPALDGFDVNNLHNGFTRPTTQANAWVADFNDTQPAITLTWAQKQTIARVELVFDPDWDHPMETVLWGHPERVSPYCVPAGELRDGSGQVLARFGEQHHARCELVLDQPVTTDRLTLHLTPPESGAPAALFALRCYAN